MKKRLFFLLFSLLFLPMLVACSGNIADDLLSEIEERGTIRVSTNANNAPRSYLDEGGKFVGFDIDVATEIAERLGVEAEFVTPDWDAIVTGNWEGEWDMNVGSMLVTTERQKVLDFAEPAYYYTTAQFAAAVGSDIETLADIEGEAVCVGLSTIYETWLSGDIEGLGLPESSFYANPPANVTVVPLQTDNDCFQSIQAGRDEFRVFLTSNTVVEAAIEGGIPVTRVDAPVFSENLAVAFDKNSPLSNEALVERVSEIIADMHANGILTELSLKWFSEDLTTNPTQ